MVLVLSSGWRRLGTMSTTAPQPGKFTELSPYFSGGFMSANEGRRAESASDKQELL
jgi:hypothetical protein